MSEVTMPWKNIIEFHREIAIRSEESFFSFEIQDLGSERFSFIDNQSVQNLQIASRLNFDSFSNQTIFTNVNQKNTGFYIGGVFWFTNKLIDGNWVKYAHPLLYKPVVVKKATADNAFEIEPEQAKWDISPMFYKLLDKKGIVPNGNIEDIIHQLIEKSDELVNEQDYYHIFKTQLLGAFPELKKEFVENVPYSFDHQWLVFVAPRDFSAIQRNLISDYSKLIHKLEDDPTALGGFRIFEKKTVPNLQTINITPLIPLNEAQLRVVKKVISGNEITVVSGPPGCGKSQVVISILLNAWKNGQSALFASSNNQAVDVVRERMRKYESQVPIVVRCGSRSATELLPTLDRMQTIIDNYDADNLPNYRNSDITRLEKELKEVTDLLNSNLPQRISELSKAALNAYGKAGEYRESWEAELSLYESKLECCHISVSPEVLQQTILTPFSEWLDKHSFMIDEINRGVIDKSTLLNNIEELQLCVVNELSHYYKSPSCDRLITESHFQEITKWYSEYKNFLLQFIEADLQESEWKPEYDSWSSISDAKHYIGGSNEVISYFAQISKEYSATIEDINSTHTRLKSSQDALRNVSIKPFDSKKIEALNQWITLYNKYLMLPKKFSDSLPFSTKSKLDRQLTEIESSFFDCFVAGIVGEQASDSAKRRLLISTYSDKIFDEYNAQIEVANLAEKESLIRNKQTKLNDLLINIGESPVINLLDLASCKLRIEEIKENQTYAKEAIAALEKMNRKHMVVKKDRDIRFRGSQLLYPVSDGIKDGSDIESFFNVINNNLFKELSIDALQKAREATNKHSVELFFDSLSKACEQWDEIDLTYVKLSNIKSDNQLQQEWLKECPNSLSHIFSNMTYKNAIIEADKQYIYFSEFNKEWLDKGKPTIERLKSNEQHEYQWATSNLSKALELCPGSILPEKKESILNNIRNQPWDIGYIRNLFSRISSDSILIRQARLKASLENALLSKAVTQRMSELYNDNKTKAALAKLQMEYRKTDEVIMSSAEDDFVTALNALPIWITTGQSPQAIPMKPDIFDLLIIDEATQCTITSILPLIYRCKRIIVIGDSNQLTAIDNISITAERFLANKFGIENYLHIIGHCGCNIYKSILNMIPIKEGNVISLTDHYRSHPLIIGFSNYFVYRNKLVLKKAMQEINYNRVSGVFGINIPGNAFRDTKTDSWCNEEEADKVIELIKSFKDVPEYNHFSIGVITPFRGQVNLINSKLAQLTDITNIFVSTVHKYQGDEKDIIIFSPVVSKGITPGAANWVENPPNLINVAVTRAREALYIISDFEVSRRQPGILGNLIRYVEQINLLRKTSQFELQLFGLMVLQGWEIDVHPRIHDIEVDFIVKYLGNRVVVEVDGRQHEHQRVADRNRDAMLAGKGYDVIRILTREIVDTPFEVIDKIRNMLQRDIL